MNRENKKNGNLLITRFPLESAWGGEEKLHLLLAELLRRDADLSRPIETLVWSSCAPLIKGFQEKKFRIFRAFFVPDITSKSGILLSPFSLLFLLFQIPFVIFWAKKNGAQSVLMLSLIEKIFLTPLFKACGMKVIWAHHAPVGNWLSKNPFFFLWKHWAKKVQIVVPSEYLKEKIMSSLCPPSLRKRELEGVFEKNITVIPNTITPPQKIEKKNIEEFLQEKCRGTMPRAQSKIIGFAARLEKNKNPQQMLELAKKMPDHLFIIAGEGSEKKSIEQKISAKKTTVIPDSDPESRQFPNNIFLLGHLSEKQLPSFYQSLDVFCALSEVETFGLSAAEAQSYGVPVLAPNAGALPEVIMNKKTGILFEAKNIGDAITNLKKLLEDDKLRKKMGNAAKEHAKNFSEEKYVERMKKILFPKK